MKKQFLFPKNYTKILTIFFTQFSNGFSKGIKILFFVNKKNIYYKNIRKNLNKCFVI